MSETQKRYSTDDSAKSDNKQLRCAKVLVTGAAGFVGKYLVKELMNNGHTVLTTDVLPSSDLPNYKQAELCDKDAMRLLVRETQPDAIIHLAAISFVPDGDKDPSKLLSVNVAGTVNILDAIRYERPKCRILFISTAQVYGPLVPVCLKDSPTPDTPNTPENVPLFPMTMYAISKVAAEHAVSAYGQAYGIDALIARPSNHTGPGQSPKFVTASFAKQVADVKCGKANTVRGGNLNSVRDFIDVRDVVRAYRLIIELGHTGCIYNIAANTRTRIGELLERLQKIANTNAPFEADPTLYRESDASLILNTSNLINHTNWAPEYNLDTTLSDMLSEFFTNKGRT